MPASFSCGGGGGSMDLPSGRDARWIKINFFAEHIFALSWDSKRFGVRNKK
jgi:hypothetical protein